ncbi:hypothetical protein CDO09_18670 [Xanthomonas perforans]|nr:hypothetical protein BJD13_06895 [Xanthomonas perforans]AQS75379.1 hypothetical protein XPE_02845 [Xanthomonas perforans 91-118]PWH21907.1 hypothetical protein CDO09_18670 [Xanthomonas perforans]
MCRVSTQQPATSSRAKRCPKHFSSASRKLSGAVSLPVAGPLAAWMPPSSRHGRFYGMSRGR